MPPVSWDLHYDRRVSDEFLAEFLPGGAAEHLVEYARFAAYPTDLQMRREAKNGAEHATLYVGLTAVLNIHRRKNGFALRANSAFAQAQHGWRPEWSAVSKDDLANNWRKVEDYLERVIPHAHEHYGSPEGPVQAAVSVHWSPERVMVDREVAMHFKDAATKKQIFTQLTAPFLQAVKDIPEVPDKAPTSFGGECDLLALDSAGRLLAVEIKPAGVSTIVWATAQATVYAQLLERWVRAAPAGTDRPVTILRGMLDQRARLGLAPAQRPGVPERPVVVPVVGIQRGQASKAKIEKMKKVQKALVAAGCGNEDLEVYEVSLAGRMTRLL